MNTVQTDLNEFVQGLQQEVLTGCMLEGEEAFREDKFTEIVIHYLTFEAEELDGAEVFSHRGRGLQVNGYSVSDDEQSLDLFITDYNGTATPSSLPRSIVQASFRRLTTFLSRSLDGYYRQIEEASQIFDVAQRIHELKASLTRVRLFLLTDSIAAKDPLPDTTLGSIQLSHHIWDVERLHRLLSSGRRREAIEIDFSEICGGPVPCLMMPNSNPDYATYLAILPGTVLVQLYNRFANRLLERNVRSFLQVRGKVNADIRRTILTEPHMFLAFNNGIAGTAESIEIVTLGEERLGIKYLRDFQIVNGGQTIASLYHASTRDNADVSSVAVQVKLTVIKDPTRVDEIVPRISRYANSQNQITGADFSANHPFHRAIEAYSRTIWAPAKDGTQHLTRWYYERARSQYADDKERERTPAKKRKFEIIHPPTQRFNKTELAKFENTWVQLPWIVSRGAEKNFHEFMVRLEENGGSIPDQAYFERLVAKAILFRTAVKLIRSQKYGAYPEKIAIYTLAKLSHDTAQRVDLSRIWHDQDLSLVLKDTIMALSSHAHKHIMDAPGNGNVGEWCKKEDCWKRFRDKALDTMRLIADELKSVGLAVSKDGMSETVALPENESITRVQSIPGQVWFEVSSWAKETNNLQAWQRSLAFSLGKTLSNGRPPTIKQAIQGVRIIEEAERLGFIAAAPESR